MCHVVDPTASDCFECEVKNNIALRDKIWLPKGASAIARDIS
jgi:hypothetical protein